MIKGVEGEAEEKSRSLTPLENAGIRDDKQTGSAGRCGISE